LSISCWAATSPRRLVDDEGMIRLRLPRTSRRLLLLGICVLSISAVSPAVAAAATTTATTSIDTSKQDCVYSAHSISILDSFEQLVGRPINCVTVYTAPTTWQNFETPWFINYYASDSDWSQWATTPGTQRRLVIGQPLFPTSADNTNWLEAGASGAYAGYDRALAQNLVAAGLGNSIIRLGYEANGTWNADSFGSTPAKWALWDQFWSRTVLAMRSVPGAHFLFDWCIAALYRPLPLAQIYPGNSVVNIIGIDAYDTGNLGSTAAARWNTVYNGADGIADVLNFAKANGKPISIPEWGVSPTADSDGFGADPTFVNGIASVVRNNPVAYQSYFYKYGYATQLADGPLSLTAYRADFGAEGTSVGSNAARRSSTKVAAHKRAHHKHKSRHPRPRTHRKRKSRRARRRK
jgi:hypothetical protein